MESTAKSELMASLLENQETINMMLAGATMVQIGGVEGIQFAAEQQPELLLDVIDGLMKVLNNTWTDHLAFVESHFAIMDEIDNITEYIQETFTE